MPNFYILIFRVFRQYAQIKHISKPQSLKKSAKCDIIVLSCKTCYRYTPRSPTADRNTPEGLQYAYLNVMKSESRTADFTPLQNHTISENFRIVTLPHHPQKTGVETFLVHLYRQPTNTAEEEERSAGRIHCLNINQMLIKVKL